MNFFQQISDPCTSVAKNSFMNLLFGAYAAIPDAGRALKHG
jgi:hypothetical protein